MATLSSTHNSDVLLEWTFFFVSTIVTVRYVYLVIIGIAGIIELAEMIGRLCWPVHMSITNARPIILTRYIDNYLRRYHYVIRIVTIFTVL